MAVRTWISAVEAASLIWLDEGKQPPLPELRDWLVDHFVAVLTATAAGDAGTAAATRRALALEEHDGAVADLVGRVLAGGRGVRASAPRPPGTVRHLKPA